MIKKGSYVEIEVIILNKENRAPQIPLDTKEVDLKMRVKGILKEDANIGDLVKIITDTKRIEEGILIKDKPAYLHNFGEFVEELQTVREVITKEMSDSNE